MGGRWCAGGGAHRRGARGGEESFVASIRRRRSRARRLRGRAGPVDRAAGPERGHRRPLRGDGEDRQHPRGAAPRRARGGRCGLRGGRGGEHHPAGGGVPLPRARPGRARALGQADRPEPGVAHQRGVRLFGRRPVRHRLDQHRAGDPARRVPGRPDDVPGPGARRPPQPLRPRRPDVRAVRGPAAAGAVHLPRRGRALGRGARLVGARRVRPRLRRHLGLGCGVGDLGPLDLRPARDRGRRGCRSRRPTWW